MKAVISTLMLVFATAIAALSPALAAPNMAPPAPDVIKPAPSPRMVAAFTMKPEELAHAVIRLPPSVVSLMTPGPAQGLYKVCVGTDGRITGVHALLSIPNADQEIANQIRAGWAFRTRVDPVCFPQFLKFNIVLPPSAATFGKLTVECSTTSTDVDGCMAVATQDAYAGRATEARILDRFCRLGQMKACLGLGNCISNRSCNGDRATALAAFGKACSSKLADGCWGLAWAALAHWEQAKVEPAKLTSMLHAACDLGSGRACVALFSDRDHDHDAVEAKKAEDHACAIGTTFCDQIHQKQACPAH